LRFNRNQKILNMRTLITFLVLGMMLCACEHPHPKAIEADLVLEPPPPSELSSADAKVEAPESNITQPATTDTSKKVIKTGEMSFEVDNLDKARKKILKAVKTLGGYVAEENQSNEHGSRNEYVLKLRVPAKNFDRLLDSVSSGARKIDMKDISVKDVTTEFIDVKAQLANSKVLEDTYLGMLKKAGRISDMLEIESKVTEIRTQIDSTQGVLNYLSRQTELASLNLNFYTQQVDQESDDSIWSRFKASFGDGWGALQSLFFGLISIWPLVLLLLICFPVIRRWWKARKQTATPASN